MPERLHPVAYEFSLPKGPEGTWQVVRVELREQLSRAYALELELVSDDPTLAWDELLGADAELRIDRSGVARSVTGVIEQVDALLSSESRVERALQQIRVTIVPAFALLDQSLDTRFFQGQTVVEIVEALLGEALAPWQRRVDASSRVAGRHEKRDYCVQFRETTYAFINRLLEEEGIAYHFVVDEDAHVETLVLIDNAADASEVELLVPGPLPIVMSRAEQLERESLHGFAWREATTPNRVVTRGYAFKTATTFDEGSAARSDAHHPRTRELYFDDDRRQVVDDPLGDPESRSFTGADVAQRQPLAERLLQLHALAAARGEARSNAIGMTAGGVFTLGEHPVATLAEQDFLITEVVHVGTSGFADGSEAGYRNELACIRRGDPFRPPLRTAKPRVAGVQLGVVVGPSQAEIHTDPYGRIKVLFHGDRHGGHDERASCWIRVARSWSGAGFGSLVIPRVGMEVVVAFVDGNPDCPLVIGCVYDSANMPPYALPDEATKTTFKTRSSPGGDGFNELRFEDAHGSEQVFVHAQRRMDLRVRGSLYQTAGGSREERVGSDGAGDHNTFVHKDVNHHALEVRYEKTEKEQYETVMLDVIEDLQQRHMVLVGELHQLSAPKVVLEASGALHLRGGALALTGSDTLDVKAGGKLAIESNNAIELKVGGSFVSISPGGIAIQAVSVRINSGGGVGPAGEAEAAVSVDMLDPLDALAADDGRIHHGGGGGGSGRSRTGRTLDPHHAPPLRPPPPPPPGNPTVRPDGTLRQFLTIEWVETETWCSEPATLRGTTQGYTDGDTESANVRTAADGTVERAQTLTITGNAYSQAVDMVNFLPRRVGANFESERTLDATAVGQTTPTAIRLRFIPTLAQAHCSTGGAHFDLAASNYEVQILGNINYVQGWLRFCIQLDDTVPAGTGGLIGLSFATHADREYSGGDWRYGQRAGGTNALQYWDGSNWVNVPAAWTQNVGVRNRLLDMAIWSEGGTNHTQYGTLAWPGTIPAWGPTETALAATVLPQWVTEINGTWTNKFDIKRDQCRSTDAQCCRYKTRCSVVFTQTAAKGSGIVLAANNGRSNSEVWSMASGSPMMPSHEFGHHLGNPDEYEGAGVDRSLNGDGAVNGIDDDSIMGRNKTHVKVRHYRTICTHLASMVSTEVGRTYTYQAVAVV